ncbi:Uncharacterized protein FKW44_021142, partial [Caligus rogercresseyi]
LGKKKEMVKPFILRSVMLSAAARYTALSLKIPSDTKDSWSMRETSSHFILQNQNNS